MVPSSTLNRIFNCENECHEKMGSIASDARHELYSTDSNNEMCSAGI